MAVDRISLNLLLSSINMQVMNGVLMAIRAISNHFLLDNQTVVETIKSENQSMNSSSYCDRYFINL